jgi:NADH-quinone oxidoreductase subunit J
MIPDLILFFGLALVAIASGIGLLVSRSAIYAALNLLINLTAIAVYYLILHAPFIALVQIAVYAGAIMVLFIFVIMLLGAEKLPDSAALPWQQPLAIFLGLILIVETGYVIFFRADPVDVVSLLPAGFGSPKVIGEMLFSQYLFPFEIVSILLLAALVGAIVITNKGGLKRK